MITAILRVALVWQAWTPRRMGIADISLADGPKTPDHGTHRGGPQVDVGALRKDGREAPVRWSHPEYNLEATVKLLELFRAYAPVTMVLFNDKRVPFTKIRPGHDNHMHIELQG